MSFPDFAFYFRFQACGFEILVSQCKGSNDAENQDLSMDKGWNHYFNSLKDKGYFKVRLFLLFKELWTYCY